MERVCEVHGSNNDPASTSCAVLPIRPVSDRPHKSRTHRGMRYVSTSELWSFSFQSRARSVMKSILPELVAALLVAASSSVVTSCVTQPPSPSIVTYRQMDQFQDELASRASQRLGSSSDFKIVVTQAEVPIGTILRRGTTIPIDYTSCVPDPAPPSASTPNLFPPYSISKSLAIDFGLDNAAITEIGALGVKVSDIDAIGLSVSSPRLQALSDHQLANLINADGCSTSIAGDSPVWLVRGYILGKRNFSLTDTSNKTFTAKVVKVGAFDVDFGSGSSSLKIVDDTDTGFLQIVSEVTKTSTRGPIRIASPMVTSTEGRVYIQRDRADNSGNAEKVADVLSGLKFSVAGSAEKIDSGKMPTKAQVRYFNASDKSSAETALRALREQYPDAGLKLVGLPAPPKQLEVWLPRVGTEQTHL